MGRGSTHHFALTVGSEEELAGLARLPDRPGIPVTEVHGPHLLQVGLPARPRRPHRRARHARARASPSTSRWRTWAGRPVSSGRRGSAAARPGPSRRVPARRPSARARAHAHADAASRAPAGCASRPERSSRSAPRRAQDAGARSASRPACSRGRPRETSSLLQRVLPQRFWLISRSLIDMLCACQGQLSTTSAAESSPAAMRRFIRARARRTRLAYSRARRCCS